MDVQVTAAMHLSDEERGWALQENGCAYARATAAYIARNTPADAFSRSNLYDAPTSTPEQVSEEGEGAVCFEPR